MRARLTLLPIVAVLFVAGVFASSAAADDFSPKTICVIESYPAVPEGCDSVQPRSRNGLQAAIDFANSQLTYRGDDTIRIDPGTIEIINPVQTISFTAAAGFGALHIVGAGRGATKLSGVYTEGPGPIFSVVQMNVAAAPTSSIEDLSIEPGPGSTSIIGLAINGGSVDGVGIRAFGDPEFIRRGLVTTGDGVTVKNSAISGGGTDNGYGIYNIGYALSVQDTTFENAVNAYDNENYGIYSTGSLIGRRLKFIGEKSAITFAGTQLDLYDSLFVMGAAASAITVTPGGSNAGFSLQGLTFVGDAPNQTAIKATASTYAVSGDVRDSIFDLDGAGSTEISCVVPGGGSPSQVYIFNSMYATTAGNCFMQSVDGVIRSGSVQPAYVSSTTGDFRPAAGSPVIDAGSTTAHRPFDPKIDLGGMQRFVDGNGDGSVITDIGAFEFQPSPPVPPVGGGGGTAPTGFEVTLGKPTGKFKLKKKIFPFKAGTAKSKPRIAVSSNRAATVTLILLKPKAGYAKGSKCVAKKPKTGKRKRCDLPIKGKQAYRIPLGSSFLQFGAKWAGKKLKPGKYVLSMKAQGLNDAPKSILNVIR